MGKYFGTDGIRGEANKRLNIEIAVKVGQYLGHIHKGKKIVVGQDTRLSSTMFASAIAAGATAMGADVYMLGVCATPALAYTVINDAFAGGVMISASHNPFQDNGLKVFAGNGMKISAELEADIEQFIDGEITLDVATGNEIGVVVDFAEGLNTYLDYAEALIDVRFDGLNIVLDVANGSAVSSAERAFKELGATVTVMHNQPDGININTNCGSTHPESLIAKVKELGADMGFAFDGDADRCLAVNGNGELVDGDEILYILGLYLRSKGMLRDNMVVSTVMANLGFMKSCKKAGLNVVATDVGDKHVFAEMVEHDYKLGGEQSGHIILRDYATTGDGVLTALVITEVVAKSGKTLVELGSDFVRFPQLLENLIIEDKEAIMNHPDVQAAIVRITQELGDNGRILVRPSGTEQLIRVMVEAESDDLCKHYVSDMMNIIKNSQ
ncbi:phosphoglucosamine mutase [Erysipelothrix sp. HDW6C]|uniref:phosphoglucosamine mutase n=1 Tax=Erysipelothrix sp. HDW6C TaxID=2714930 RepID=UPI001409010A|nr:phosphoglucosamine mutase [Erysipelothrix sp. HDW6C]QIK69349.1 phosphoglucosamine mutase [Erysipelothrix sp. HDW6C]